MTRPTLLICMLLIAWQAISNDATAAQQSEESIATLITQLNSGDYQQRDQATRILADRPESLSALCRAYFQATPEEAWRIKTICEGIATNSSDEATSTKAIAILVTLDAGPNAQKLLTRYRENRSLVALGVLQKAGAVLQSNSNTQMFRGGAFLAEQLVEQESNQLQFESTNKLTSKQQKELLKKIATNTIEENHELVRNSIRLAPPNPAADLSAGSVVIEGRAWANRGGVLTPLGGSRPNEVSIRIGDQWHGTDEDFDRLKDIHNLYGVSIKNQKLTARQIKILGKLPTIRHLGLSNSKVNRKRLSSITLPDTIESVELKDTRIDEPLIEWLAGRAIHRLLVDKCEITGQAVNKIDTLQELQNVSLKRVRIDSRMWKEFENLKTLRSIELSACKHSKNELLKFRLVKPGVSISHTPVAFLGVKTLNNFGGGPCKVTEVVPNSAASRDGIENGDVIESINGQLVEEFQNLREALSQYDENEPVVIKVIRELKPVELNVTLGSVKQQTR